MQALRGPASPRPPPQPGPQSQFVGKTFLRERLEACLAVLPLVSVVAIFAIVAAVVAGSQQKIATSGLLIFAVVVLHNVLGLLLGYLLAKAMG